MQLRNAIRSDSQSEKSSSLWGYKLKKRLRFFFKGKVDKGKVGMYIIIWLDSFRIRTCIEHRLHFHCHHQEPLLDFSIAASTLCDKVWSMAFWHPPVKVLPGSKNPRRMNPTIWKSPGRLRWCFWLQRFRHPSGVPAIVPWKSFIPLAKIFNLLRVCSREEIHLFKGPEAHQSSKKVSRKLKRWGGKLKIKKDMRKKTPTYYHGQSSWG